MGLIKKFKDILFDEEVVEVKEPKIVEEDIPVKQVKEEIRRETPKPAPSPQKENLYATSERELFKSEKTFNFPDFDESEFDNSYTSKKKEPTPNAVEYERKKKVEKRTDYGRHEKVETREVVEKRKFKPSPVISPVYGIMSKDFDIEELKTPTHKQRDNLNVDDVRRKAFEPTVEVAKKEAVIYEETPVVSSVVLPKEKELSKTLDELLQDTSDVTIDIDEDFDTTLNGEMPVISESIKEERAIEDIEEDTLENDLFDLIDSMYDMKGEDE